ncbi:MAG: glycosyltransferase [Bdellovibrionales bacterium]
MKTLHVITTMDTGGAEMMLNKLVRAAENDKSQQMAILSLGRFGTLGAKLREDGFEIHALELRKSFHFLKLLFLRKRISFKPDVIQGWMYHGNVFATLIKYLAFPSAETGWSIRQSLSYYKEDKPMTRFIIRLSAWLSFLPKAIIYNSYIAKEQHEDFGYSSKSSVVIPNGFNIEIFKPDNEMRSHIRQELGLEPNHFVVGNISRNHPVKNFKLLVDAVLRVSDEIPEIRCLCIGRDTDRLMKFIPNKKSHLFRLIGECKKFGNT